MSIFSAIANIGSHCDTDEWRTYGNDAFKIFIQDKSVLSLINSSMKLEHITVIKPLLEIIGNILVVDDTLAIKLVQIPEFFTMIKFWFNSRNGVLIRLAFWVISNMIASNKPIMEESLVNKQTDIIDMLMIHLELFKEIMESFINDHDVSIRKEALHVLYYCVSEKPNWCELFQNNYSIDKMIWILDDYKINLPETNYAVISLLDFCK